MKNILVLMGALLLAAPAFSQQDELLTFQLKETREQVAQRMGRPALVAPFGEFESWQYQIGVEDNHEFSHIFLFRVSTGELLSVTRNWEHERSIEELLPLTESKAYYYPDSKNPVYGVRVRRLSEHRVLMAMGAAENGQPTGQVVLIRESELHHFHPWLKLD
jgi:hypothetical protein